MRSKLGRYMINLEHFATVAQYGSISAASSVLAITQPALTRSIMKLEDVLGVPVLDRSPRGVSPTECGRALLEYIHAAETELNKALAVVQAIRGINDGRINCGAGGLSMNHILPSAMSRAKHKLKKIRVNLVEGRTRDLLHRLKNCELDLVLGIEQTDDLFADLYSERLIKEQFLFCVRSGHRLGNEKNVKLGDLLGREHIVLPALSASPVEHALNLELRRLGCTLGEHCVETLSHAVMRQLIYEDDYVAFCSSIWFREDIHSGALKVLQGDWNILPFDTLLFRRNSDTAPSWMPYFVDEIKNAAAGLRTSVE